MLKVMRNHRRAAYDAKGSEYEGLTITPMGIDAKRCPSDLLDAAKSAWDRAVQGGGIRLQECSDHRHRSNWNHRSGYGG